MRCSIWLLRCECGVWSGVNIGERFGRFDDFAIGEIEECAVDGTRRVVGDDKQRYFVTNLKRDEAFHDVGDRCVAAE